jgi:hypothetical protein
MRKKRAGGKEKLHSGDQAEARKETRRQKNSRGDVQPVRSMAVGGEGAWGKVSLSP